MKTNAQRKEPFALTHEVEAVAEMHGTIAIVALPEGTQVVVTGETVIPNDAGTQYGLATTFLFYAPCGQWHIGATVGRIDDFEIPEGERN